MPVLFAGAGFNASGLKGRARYYYWVFSPVAHQLVHSPGCHWAWVLTAYTGVLLVVGFAFTLVWCIHTALGFKVLLGQI